MAKNDENNRDNSSLDTRSHQGTIHDTQRATDVNRDRRRDRVVNTVKERPYATAALATVAAGAAAFFLTRGKSDKPLMNWGQEGQGDRLKGAGAYKQQGSTSSDGSLETASASPSSSAGVGAGTGGTSPSAMQAATLSTSGSSTSASATGASSGSSDASSASTTPSPIPSANLESGTGSTAASTGASNASGGDKTGTSGLDDTAKTETKVGAISYGA